MKILIEGKVMDNKNQLLDFASVQLLKNNVVVGGSKTDLNGRFKIISSEPGTYVSRVAYAGFSESRTELTLTQAEHHMYIKLKPTTFVTGLIGIISRPLLSDTPGVQRYNKEQIKNFGL